MNYSGVEALVREALKQKGIAVREELPEVPVSV